MFTAILSGAQQTLLERLSDVATVRTFYLAGGTALALHLGHRRSVDFDFFRSESFDPSELIRSLNPLGTLAVQRAERDTLTVQIAGVATSFFAYPHALLQPVLALPWSVSVAAVGDIAAMKLSAIAGRGSRKDFVDLYFICREGMRLAAVLQLFEEKFRNVPYERYHILKSLTFFDDAEAEVMPEMLRPASWQEIKHFFVTEVPPLFTAG
jgi:predicted nucleotidyltransferase component of viral defense system